ncbi:MAG: hypothetical protein JNM52_08785 [Betaproteobacteria bacterium]|nr:hypothetical protein [Betaproteobacteria bacterium]
MLRKAVMRELNTVETAGVAGAYLNTWLLCDPYQKQSNYCRSELVVCIANQQTIA